MDFVRCPQCYSLTIKELNYFPVSKNPVTVWLRCLQCHHVWTGRVKEPARCSG
jgi:predicted Zn-ribbon and HTH transcriptional regulator